MQDIAIGKISELGKKLKEAKRTVQQESRSPMPKERRKILPQEL